MKACIEFDWSTICKLEDSLQEAHIFLNGIRGTPCHSDSYMTVVDFVALDKWMAEQKFEREALEFCVNYWLTNENMQPPLRLVAMTIQRKLLQ